MGRCKNEDVLRGSFGNAVRMSAEAPATAGSIIGKNAAGAEASEVPLVAGEGGAPGVEVAWAP